MKKLLFLSLLATLFFAGCTSAVKKNAKVIDSAVEGLEYQCAGDTQFTDKSGLASCYHLPIGFKIGGIILGKLEDMPSDGIILPQDIVKVDRKNLTNKEVVKLTLLLQALDKDKNASNGITITKEVRDKLDKVIYLKQTSLEELKDYVTTKLGYDPFDDIDTQNALKHLRKSMRKYNINTPNIDL